MPPSSTERVQLIVDASSLISDAAQRGDDRAAAILTRLVAFMVKADADLSALEQRRESDRQRPPRPRKSKESVEIQGIRGDGELRSSSSSLDSRDREKDSTTTPRASTAESVVSIEPDVQQRFDMLRARMGDEFPAADAFVRRRPYRTWLPWLDEMLADIGPGSQYLPCDLARVCKDEGALERPIGSPRGLRSFLLNAREERIAPAAGGSQPRLNSQQRARKALDGIR